MSFVYSDIDDAIYVNQVGAFQKLVDKYDIKTSRSHTVPANHVDFTVGYPDSQSWIIMTIYVLFCH